MHQQQEISTLKSTNSYKFSRSRVTIINCNSRQCLNFRILRNSIIHGKDFSAILRIFAPITTITNFFSRKNRSTIALIVPRTSSEKFIIQITRIDPEYNMMKYKSTHKNLSSIDNPRNQHNIIHLPNYRLISSFANFSHKKEINAENRYINIV